MNASKRQKKSHQCWVGVDGTRTGWVAFIWQDDDTYHLWHLSNLQELDNLSSRHHQVNVNAIGIDIPIGLSEVAEKGGRGCDRQARKLLSTAKRNAKSVSSSSSSRLVGSSSIFTPPCRKALDVAFNNRREKGNESCCTHEQVSAANKQSVLERSDGDITSSKGGLGLSIQTFHILPKIKEADDFVSPSLISSDSIHAVSVISNIPVLECHPELGFLSLSMVNKNDDYDIEEVKALYSKKIIQGRRQRLELLCQKGHLDVNKLLLLAKAHQGPIKTTSQSPIEQISQMPTWKIASLTDESDDRKMSIAADDVLDAMACAIISKRWSLGQAKAVSEDGETKYDNRRLPMVIWR